MRGSRIHLARWKPLCTDNSVPDALRFHAVLAIVVVLSQPGCAHKRQAIIPLNPQPAPEHLLSSDHPPKAAQETPDRTQRALDDGKRSPQRDSQTAAARPTDETVSS